MTTVNIDIVDRIIEAVYKKYKVRLKKIEILIDDYEETRESIYKPRRFNTTYNVVIPIGDKEYPVYLIKSEIDETTDIASEIENQINKQTKL